MATLTRRVSKSANIGGTTYIAYVMVTLTYTQTTANKTVSITASNVSVSSVSYQGGTNVQNRNIVKEQLAGTLSSATVTATFGGQTLFSKYSLAIGGSYSVSGTKSVSRGTSATTATLAMSVAGGTASTTITVPALPNWAVTFYGNTGTSVPSPQTKFLDINLSLTNAQPNKDEYTFRGWATSAERAGVPNIDWSGGQVYQTNAKLDLYAIWERNYRKPTINHLDVDRCDVDGEFNDDGTYALVTFEWSVFRTNDTLYVGGSTTPYANNSVSLCEITVGSHTATPTLTGQSGTASVIVGNGTYDADTSYAVSVSITDKQEVKSDNTTTIEGLLSMSLFPMDINEDATAIGFFRPAPNAPEEGAFFAKKVDAPTFSVEGAAIVDHVIGQGTDGIWTYRKWNSGIAECWGTFSSTSSHYAGPYASFLYGYNYLNLAFPSGLFKSGTRPYAVYGVKVGTAFSMAAANLAVSNTGINLYALANVSGSQSIMWDIQVKGRWK